MPAVYDVPRACMDQPFADMNREGWLHSSFHTAVNLFFPPSSQDTGRLITLLAPGRALVPDSLLLSEEAFAAVQWLPLNSRVQKQGTLLIWENPPLCLSFGHTRTGNPLIPACHAETILRAVAQIRTNAHKSHGLEQLYGAGCAGRIQGLYWLTESLKRGQTVQALHQIVESAGAGPGLTPSSDDMMVGILTVLRSLGCRAPFPDAAAAYAALEGRTTDVGRQYICRALEGCISETMRDALAGNVSAWNQLAETGATSGIDTLTGLEIGCRVWIKPTTGEDYETVNCDP